MSSRCREALKYQTAQQAPRSLFSRKIPYEQDGIGFNQLPAEQHLSLLTVPFNAQTPAPCPRMLKSTRYSSAQHALINISSYASCAVIL